MQSIGSRGISKSGWLRAPAAAEFVGLSTSTLAKMRLTGAGPAFAKAGKVIVYDVAALEAWLQGRSFRSTSEYGGGDV